MCKQSDIKVAKPITNGSVNARALAALYALTTFLCLFMVAWIGVFPSSWLMGRSDWHDRIINKTMVETYDGTSVSPRTVTKYAGHSLVQFTHIAPGAIWAGAIPLQLHPNVRGKYRWAHKITGYAFVVCALLMAFGICVIFARDLTFHNDYEGIPPADDLELLQIKVSTIFLTSWFALTVLLAVYNAGWAKDIKSHQKWIIRHIGSGLWIALQRVVLMIIRGTGLMKNPLQVRNLFGNAATGSVVVTVVLAEYAIRCLKDGTGVEKSL